MADNQFTVRGVFELTLRLEGDHLVPDLHLYDQGGQPFTLPIGFAGRRERDLTPKQADRFEQLVRRHLRGED